MTQVEARKAFTKAYGKVTVGVVTDLARNRSVKTIMKTRKVSKGTVAAIQANLTRDTYAEYARLDSYGVYGTAYGY